MRCLLLMSYNHCAQCSANGAGSAHLPENPSSPAVFSGVCVTRSLVLCACFVNRCLFVCTFSFGHCVVCSSSTCWFWLPLWYLQTLLNVFTCSPYNFICYLRKYIQSIHNVSPLQTISNCLVFSNVTCWQPSGYSPSVFVTS